MDQKLGPAGFGHFRARSCLTPSLLLEAVEQAVHGLHRSHVVLESSVARKISFPSLHSFANASPGTIKLAFDKLCKSVPKDRN